MISIRDLPNILESITSFPSIVMSPSSDVRKRGAAVRETTAQVHEVSVRTREKRCTYCRSACTPAKVGGGRHGESETAVVWSRDRSTNAPTSRAATTRLDHGLHELVPQVALYLAEDLLVLVDHVHDGVHAQARPRGDVLQVLVQPLEPLGNGGEKTAAVEPREPALGRARRATHRSTHTSVSSCDRERRSHAGILGVSAARGMRPTASLLWMVGAASGRGSSPADPPRTSRGNRSRPPGPSAAAESCATSPARPDSSRGGRASRA